MLVDQDIIIIGAGLSGSTIAACFAKETTKTVAVIEKREHIGGNCYDYRNEFGHLECKYGAHIFHTQKKHVWDFIHQYCDWIPYRHKVYSNVHSTLVPIPINITTIRRLFPNDEIQTGDEMKTWIASQPRNLLSSSTTTSSHRNGRDVIVSQCGDLLYEWMFKHYTKKQWDLYPEELDPSVLRRIPIRYSEEEGYFNDPYEALPKHGYTHFIQSMLDHPQITVFLNTDWKTIRRQINVRNDQIVIYTGPIDHYFEELHLPPLEYRSLRFERLLFPEKEKGDYYQSNSVVNYPEPDVSFTRIVEPKHFYKDENKDTVGTVIVREYSTSEGEPYYPILNPRNLELYSRYHEEAIKLEKTQGNIYFIGRLANFKYVNMDEAIENALTFFYETFPTLLLT